MDSGVQVSAVGPPRACYTWIDKKPLDELPLLVLRRESDLWLPYGEELLGVRAQRLPGRITKHQIESAPSEDLGELDVPVEQSVVLAHAEHYLQQVVRE